MANFNEIIDQAIKAIDEIEPTVSKLFKHCEEVQKAVNRQRKDNADVESKQNQARVNVQKEENRHHEAMEKIKKELYSIQSNSEYKGDKLEVLKDLVSEYRENYKMIRELDIKEYSSPEIQKDLSNLRDNITKLSIQLLK